MELWKEIKDFENYWISSEGRVWSDKCKRFLKPREDRYGYLQVHFYRNGKHYWPTVHRLVAQAFIENPGNKPTVDHINRDTKDNRVENLRWATCKEQLENRDLTNFKYKHQKARGTAIIEKINDELTIGYPALRAVPGIDHSTLSKHVCKGEVEFTCNGRTFICAGNVIK